MQRRMVRLFWTFAVALTCSALPALAQPAERDERAAREAFERGRALYDGGEFEQAASAFEEAYRLSGRDALLYNLYLAYRDENRQQQAAEALRGYLAKVPDIENRAQLEARLAALEAGLARERLALPAEPALPRVAPAPAPAPAPALAPPSSVRPRSTRFWSGVALAGVGSALMLSSIATGVVAKDKSDQLAEACPARECVDPSLVDTRDRGQRLAHVTDGLLFGGLAVAAAGVVLVVLDWRAQRDRKPIRLSGACTRHGCSTVATVRF